MVEFR